MKWQAVGEWIRDNAGLGAALVGSLITGGVPGAVHAGIALVSSATGTNDPTEAFNVLQADPKSLVKLKELYYENEASIRKHIETIERIKFEDDQASHHETQETIRAGDRAEDRVVRWTRPGHSWLSLIGALAYVFFSVNVDVTVLGLLLALPWAYAGLRQIGKGIDSVTLKSVIPKQKTKVNTIG